MRIEWYYFKNGFSALIMSFFDKKIINVWTLEKLEIMMKSVFFSGKNVLIF